jgi:hypothetical protein
MPKLKMHESILFLNVTGGVILHNDTLAIVVAVWGCAVTPILSD